MPKILYADNDYPDLEIERALFAKAGVELVVAQCKTEDDLIKHGQGCCAILLQYAPITARVLAALPDVGIVSRIGAGYDTVDTEACAKAGVWVGNSPDYGVGEVATHALALALAAVRNIVAYHRDIGQGQWHFLSSGALARPASLTLGIVGLGRIGKRMAHMSRNVFKRVVAYDPYIIDGDFPAYVERESTLEGLARQADVVSLHTPLTKQTRGMVDARFFGAMKKRHLPREHRPRRDRQCSGSPRRPRRRRGGHRGARRAARRTGSARLRAAHPSAGDPHSARRILFGRVGARIATQGRAEHRQLARDRQAGVRRGPRHSRSRGVIRGTVASTSGRKRRNIGTVSRATRGFG